MFMVVVKIVDNNPLTEHDSSSAEDLGENTIEQPKAARRNKPDAYDLCGNSKSDLIGR
jgi:hypothetical protein